VDFLSYPRQYKYSQTWMPTFREVPSLADHQPTAGNAPGGEEAGCYDLIDLLLPLFRAKRAIASWTFVALLAGACVAFVERPVFTATAVMMPPQQEQSSAASLAGQLGALGGLSVSSALALKNPADLYVGMLRSSGIADRLIERYNLQSVYRSRSLTAARQQLHNNAEFEAAKDGLIYVRVKDRDAKRAAALANAFVEELHQLNARLASGEAAQRRLFFEQQVAEEHKALGVAEDDLRNTEEKTGIIELNGQAETTIRSIAEARAEIASREVQLGVMRGFATAQNPNVAREQREIAERRSQLAALENDQRRVSAGDGDVPAGRVPGAGLEYLRKLREVRYHESLYELLTRQAAAASLDEAKSSPLIQVVDQAQPPEQRSGPPRTLIIAGFGIAGFLCACAGVSLHEMFRSYCRTPSQAKRVAELYQSLRSSRN